MNKNNEGKKSSGFRIDTQVMASFDEYLKELKNTTGDYIPKESVVEFLMEYVVDLKPKEFLQLYYAYKSKKFSEK